MVSSIAEIKDARDYWAKRAKEAEKILKEWDRYGDEYGCMNNAMDALFRKTLDFLEGGGR